MMIAWSSMFDVPRPEHTSKHEAALAFLGHGANFTSLQAINVSNLAVI